MVKKNFSNKHSGNTAVITKEMRGNMTLISQVKHNGKKCLYNNWGKAVAIVLLSTAIFLLFMIVETFASILLGISSPAGDYQTVEGLISGIPDTTILSIIMTAVMAIGSFLIVSPLQLGIVNWYKHLSEGESEDVLIVFSCFENKKLFARSLGVNFIVGIRIFLLSILYLCLPVAGGVISYKVFQNGFFKGAEFVGSMGMALSGILFFVFLIFLLIHLQKYFLCKYYLLDGETTVRQAVRKSAQATAGLRDEVFLYKLSFIGWWLLGVLVLPLLYTSPYYGMTSMLYARFLMERDERSNCLTVYEAPYNGQQEEQTQEEANHNTEEDFAATRQFEAQKNEQ